MSHLRRLESLLISTVIARQGARSVKVLVPFGVSKHTIPNLPGTIKSNGTLAIVKHLQGAGRSDLNPVKFPAFFG
jgi:hypothetical protein